MVRISAGGGSSGDDSDDEESGNTSTYSPGGGQIDTSTGTGGDTSDDEERQRRRDTVIGGTGDSTPDTGGETGEDSGGTSDGGDGIDSVKEAQRSARQDDTQDSDSGITFDPTQPTGQQIEAATDPGLDESTRLQSADPLDTDVIRDVQEFSQRRAQERAEKFEERQRDLATGDFRDVQEFAQRRAIARGEAFQEASAEARQEVRADAGRDVIGGVAGLFGGQTAGRMASSATPDQLAADFSGIEKSDIETSLTNDGVRAQFTEDYLTEQRQDAKQQARQSIEQQIEEQTGADLDKGDIKYTQTDDGRITGKLTASGEEAVAVANAPLKNVPVAGALTTSGARVRTRGRNFFEPASDYYTEHVTNPARDLIGLSAAAAPFAVAEPTPFGEIGTGTAAGIGIGATAVGVGSGLVGNVVLGKDLEAQAQETTPSRDTLQRAATAEMGEIPTPERPASEPFPTESPTPTREVGEIFPTGSAPTETSDPFGPEQSAPESPTDPFGPEQSAPTEAPKGVAPESPPIDPSVGDTVGGPAGFGQVGQGIVVGEETTGEEEDPRTITEDDIFSGGLPMPGEPGYPGERTVEGQRVRTWPGDEPVTSEDLWRETQNDLYQDTGVRQGQSPASDTLVGPATDSRLDTLLGQDQVQGQDATQAQRAAQAQQPAQAQTPAQVEGPGYGTPPGYGFPPDYGFPTEPSYPATPSYPGYPSPPRRRPRGGDQEGKRQTTSQDGATSASFGATDTPLSAGWYSEYLTTLALGPSSPRGAPSQSTLESQPAVEAYTSTLPTEAQVSGTEQQQEAIAGARDFLTFGTGQAGVSDTDTAAAPTEGSADLGLDFGNDGGSNWFDDGSSGKQSDSADFGFDLSF